MCGRYTLRRPDLLKRFVYQSEFEEFADTRMTPRFNIYPQSQVHVVRNNKNGVPRIGVVGWGLIPHWQKIRPRRPQTIAREETVAASNMFKQAFQRRRALLAADGFYEWHVNKDGSKQPFYIRFKDNRLFGIASIWERWTDPATGNTEDTISLITTAPNGLMRPIHDRMPVLVRPEDHAAWLDRETPLEDVKGILERWPKLSEVEAYPVSAIMNSPRHDTPENVEPL